MHSPVIPAMPALQYVGIEKPTCVNGCPFVAKANSSLTTREHESAPARNLKVPLTPCTTAAALMIWQ
eukprot:3637385-Amphidinium_carterae.1